MPSRAIDFGPCTPGRRSGRAKPIVRALSREEQRLDAERRSREITSRRRARSTMPRPTCLGDARSRRPPGVRRNESFGVAAGAEPRPRTRGPGAAPRRCRFPVVKNPGRRRPARAGRVRARVADGEAAKAREHDRCCGRSPGSGVRSNRRAERRIDHEPAFAIRTRLARSWCMRARGRATKRRRPGHR
jgi:hypothetical protein